MAGEVVLASPQAPRSQSPVKTAGSHGKQQLPQSVRECHVLLIEQRRQLQEARSNARELRDLLSEAQQDARAARLQLEVS